MARLQLRLNSQQLLMARLRLHLRQLLDLLLVKVLGPLRQRLVFQLVEEVVVVVVLLLLLPQVQEEDLLLPVPHVPVRFSQGRQLLCPRNLCPRSLALGAAEDRSEQ